MPRLAEQEQQEIIRYIEADKPLPDKFRFLLFEDKREVELVSSSDKYLDYHYRICQSKTHQSAKRLRDSNPKNRTLSPGATMIHMVLLVARVCCRPLGF
jgi:hypothetical protein